MRCGLAVLAGDAPPGPVPHREDGTSGLVERRHGDLAVMWDAASPWISSDDDGTVLVVVDGRIHDPPPGGAAAPAVARAYRERGQAFARGLLGDFVAVVLDRAQRSLTVARDPVGVRPWYQSVRGRRSAGASQIGWVAALPWVDVSVDEPAALQFLAARQESRGPTLFRGITTLAPGSTWCVTPAGATTSTHHVWDLEPDLEVSWEEAAARCRAVLAEAVACRVDGAPTSELSGGLDSSIVVGTLAAAGRTDLLAARLVFDGPRADERAFSDAVLERWGIPCISAPPWIPTEEEGAALQGALHRPRPDPHFTMFGELDRALLDAGRIESLTGLGGDDAFQAVGIGPRVVTALRSRDRRVLRDIAGWVRRHPGRAWSELVRPTIGYVAAPWRPAPVPPWVDRRAAERLGLVDVLGRRPQIVTGLAAIDARMSSLTSGYDAGILEQRAALADHLGRRHAHPFLDPRFIRATYGLHPSWPLRSGRDRSFQLAAFGDRLPAAVVERRSKAEFSEIFWPQVLGEARLARLRSGPLAARGWLDLRGLDHLADAARAGRANGAIPLARCLALDDWLRTR